MPGLSFLHNLFLAGLATTAIPIIIHLLFKRQKKRIVFSAMQFLQKVTEEKAKRLRIKEWLLLAIRILIFALIALAFARPFFFDTSYQDQARIDLVILLDDSYSMATLSGDNSRFVLAKKRARERLGKLQNGDQAALVTTSGGGKIIQNLTEDLNLVRSVLNMAKVQPHFARYWPAVKRAHSLLATSEGQEKEILFLTDGQLVSWAGMRDARALDGMGKSIVLKTSLVGKRDVTNIAVLGAEVPRKIWSKDEPLKIAVKVANYGKRPARRLKLVLFLEERPVDAESIARKKIIRRLEKKFSLDAGEVGVIPLLCPLEEKEDVIGRIHLQAEDSLPIDNRFFFSIAAEDAIQVLCIEDWKAPKPFLQASYYLRRSLEPILPDESTSSGYVKTSLITTDLLSSTDLKNFQAVILVNVAELPEVALDPLEAYVQNGGGLVVFVGDQVDEAFYNKHAYREGAGWLPAEFNRKSGSTGNRENFYSLVPVAKDHELFRPYTGDVANELSSARFYRYLSVTPHKETKTIAVYDNDAPAILERKVGDGVAMLFTSTCDAEWTDLPKRGTFLPLMHQLIRYLSPKDRESRSNLQLEEPLASVFRGTRSFAELKTLSARNLSGNEIKVTEPAPESGLYFILSADKKQVLRTAAVNLNTLESNPAQVDLGEIAALGTPSEESTSAISTTGKTKWEERAKASPWWRYLLLAAVALMMVELGIANWS